LIFAGWLLSQVPEALLRSGTWVLRVPHPLLLGLIAFFMEFIPVIGMIISGAVCVIVALFVGPITAVLALAYFVVIQVLEGMWWASGSCATRSGSTRRRL
jgi:predicted PurR-regulated permease PerM